VERSRVAHAVRALDQHLGLGQILLCPVHPQTKGVTLVVDEAQALTT
jgi:hypothetical protein